MGCRGWIRPSDSFLQCLWVPLQRGWQAPKTWSGHDKRTSKARVMIYNIEQLCNVMLCYIKLCLLCIIKHSLHNFFWRYKLNEDPREMVTNHLRAQCLSSGHSQEEKKLPVPLEGPAIPGKSPSPRHIRILLEKRKKGTQPRIPPFFWTRLRFLWSHSTSPSPSTGRRMLKRWHGLLPLKVNRVKREQQLRGNLNVREHRKSWV